MSETQNSQSTKGEDSSERGKPAKSLNPQHWVLGYLPAGIGFLFWIGSVMPQPYHLNSGSYLGLMWWIPASVVLHVLCWSLIPFNSNIDGFATPNDALLLIQLARGQKADTPNTPPGAGPGSGMPKGPSWSWIVGHADANVILSRCREQLGDPNLPLEERHQVLDTSATSVLMFGAREFLDEADRYAEELYRAKPNEWTVLGTRGSILIEF